MKEHTKTEHNIELIEKTLPIKIQNLSNDNYDGDNDNCDKDNNEYTIEEAVTLTGHGKFQLYIIIVTGISVLQIVIEGGCMATVLPIAKCELGITTVEQGYLNSIIFFGIIITSQIWGLTTDIWGRKKTLQFALLMSFISSSLSSLSLNSWMLLISRFIVGMSTSGIKVASCAYLGEFISEKYRSKYFGILVSCTTFGQFVQSTIAISILPLDFEYNWWFGFTFKPWRLYIFIGSLISGLAYLGMVFLPEGPQFLLATNKHDGAMKTLQKMYSINSRLPRETYLVRNLVGERNNNYQPVESSISPTLNKKIGYLNIMWNQIWPLFTTKHIMNMLMLCLVGVIGFGIGQTFQIWYPQILVYSTNYKNMSLTMCEAVDLGHSTSRVLTNLTQASTIINNSTIPNCNIPIKTMAYQIGLFNGLFCCVTSMTASFAMERIGKKMVLISWVIISGLAEALLIWLNEFYLNNILMSLTISSLSPTNILLFIGCDLFPIKYKGMAISFVFMITRTGSVVGINLAAKLLFNHCIAFLSGNSILQFLNITIYLYIFWKLDEIKLKASENDFIKNPADEDIPNAQEAAVVDDDGKDDNNDMINQTKTLLKDGD